MSQESFNTSSNQTIYDVALTTYGTMEGVIDLLVLNSLEFDSTLPASITYGVQDNYIVKHLGKTRITTGSSLVSTNPVALPYINSGNGDGDAPVLTPSTVKVYRVKAEQSVFDIVCMLTGNMEDVMDILINNGLTFETQLNLGHQIKYAGEMYITEDITTGGSYSIKPVGAFSDGFHDGFQ
ncbi:hypothetical protein ABID22_000125 [Pontibacter aydingkolensis]|uniref:LysM domain-containing protein n=1 Tax=Pontibacter aydingkolensis TaxID=1911536 RepID=A0ABS7CQS9_9BACT|nr:hypothetical protein [Pontibacter aydingkolensis]MBW7466207.1 hypothetical protein [Pontibacter aydingkolensis]